MKRSFLIILLTSLLLMLFTLYLSFFSTFNEMLDFSIQNIFKILMIIYSLLVIFSAQWSFKRRVVIIKQEQDQTRMLKLLKNAFTIKIISVLGAAMFSYIVILITRDYIITILSILMNLILIFSWYGIKKTVKELNSEN